MAHTEHPTINTTQIGEYLFVVTRGLNYVQYECELLDDPNTYALLLCGSNGLAFAHRVACVRQPDSTPL